MLTRNCIGRYPSIRVSHGIDFAFASHNRGGNKDRAITDTRSINPTTLAREVTVAGEMVGDGGTVVGGDGVPIMAGGEDAADGVGGV